MAVLVSLVTAGSVPAAGAGVGADADPVPGTAPGPGAGAGPVIGVDGSRSGTTAPAAAAESAAGTAVEAAAPVEAAAESAESAEEVVHSATWTAERGDGPAASVAPGTTPGASDEAAQGTGDNSPGDKEAGDKDAEDQGPGDKDAGDTGRDGTTARRGGAGAAGETFTGQGFDTCAAPGEETMRAWRDASPFGAVGVYFGGRARGCEQKNLSPEWVRKVDDMGWKLLPLYVGSQSPCVRAKHKRHYRMSTENPWGQGAREGRDAVNRAQEYGMQPGSALYLDMEDYDHRDTACADATLSFVKGWNTRVSEAGYLPGFYSSAASGIAHMESARKGRHPALPEALWFARWNGRGDVGAEPVLASDAWTPHRRIHQYQGNVYATYGGRKLHIDRNAVDAPVAVVG